MEAQKFKQVSKQEFEEFVKNYPNQLDWDVTGIFDPPLGSHNDFSDGKIWPESMVTKVILYSGTQRDFWRLPEYYIRID